MTIQRHSHSAATAAIAIMAYFLTTGRALAHSGHDHAANESMLLHVLFYGSVVVAIVACVWFTYHQLNKQDNK